jgi:DNA-binding CsgD family transcriptional regulator
MAGRSEEQAYLAEVIALPEHVGVVVAGSAGVGKTRLVREVAEAAGDCHFEFVTATQSARALPFGAFAHLLPEELGSSDRVDLLPVIARHLVIRAHGKPLVLAVDDIHLLDDPSAALVHHVATSRLATMLLTLRSGEVAPDAVTALYRDGVVPRLELQAISRAEFNGLVEGVLGSSVEIRTLNRLWEATKGNVLFVRELIGDALDADALRLDHGIWRWSGALGVAPRLRETVAARLGHITDAERRILEQLAVGEPLSLESVQRLNPGVSVSHLERKALLTLQRGGRQAELRLAHPLFSEALLAAMPSSLFREINHDLAVELSRATDKEPLDPLRLAILFEGAGEEAEPTLLAEAAAMANIRSDHVLAERLARASIDGGGGDTAELELGRAFLGQNRFEEARDVLTPLLNRETSDDFCERVVYVYADAVGFGLGRIGEALEVLELAERAVSNPEIKLHLQCHRAVLLTAAARFTEAAELGALALAAVDNENVRLRSLAGIGFSLILDGRINEALAFTKNAFGSAPRLADQLPEAQLEAVAARCTALFLAGRAAEASELLDGDLGTVARVSPQVLAQVNALRGRFLLFQGKARSACRLLSDAMVTIRESKSYEPSWCAALIAEAHALLGETEEATRAAAEAKGYQGSEIAAFEPDKLRALAWADAQYGHTSSAVEQLSAAAEVAVSLGQRVYELIILDDLLRLGENGVANRILLLADCVDGEWAQAIKAHATAVISGGTGDLELAGEAFGAMGCALVAAELWAKVSEARLREGFRSRAAAAGARSAKFVALCEGARTEPLAWAVDRGTLSRREREIATLAAAGASNAHIAGRLSISVRTVESHLYAAYGKLGVADRSQLSEVLDGS